MNQNQSILAAGGMICATILGVFVAMPIIKATKAYNVSSSAYDIEATCDTAKGVADAWAGLGPLGRESSWREIERDWCSRRDARRAMRSALGVYR